MIDKLIKTEASLPMKVFMFWWEFLLKSDITIENFHDSFKDGKPFIYLAQVCEFGPFGEHQYDLKLDLKLALAVLEAYGVPKMFDEDELNKLVEEKSPILFIYAAECVIALKGKFSVDNEQCPLCGIKNSLEIENALFKHMEQHHLKSQSQFSDERFDQSMLNTFRVRRHICPECKQTFPRESTLNGHLVANHNFRKCHVGICSFAFQSDDNLQEHLGCHPEKIACTVPGCKTACYGQEALDEHKGNCHVEIRSLSLQSDDNLQEHPECRPESEKISRTVPGCETLDENKGNCHVEIRPLSLQSDDNLQEHPECRPESEKISHTVPGCETLDDHKGNCHVGVRSLSLQSDDNLQEHPESEKIACTVPGCEALDHEHKGHEHGV